MSQFFLGWCFGGFVMWIWWERTIVQAISSKPDHLISPMAARIRMRLVETMLRVLGSPKTTNEEQE